jgi:hypothetical protein
VKTTIVVAFALAVGGACKAGDKSGSTGGAAGDGSRDTAPATGGGGGGGGDPQAGDEPVEKTTPEAAAYLKKLAAHLDVMCKCADDACVEKTNEQFLDPAPSTAELSDADEKVLDDQRERMMGCTFRIHDPKGAEEYTAKRIAAEAKRAKLIPTLDAPYTLEDESARPHFDKLMAEIKQACACTTQECADAYLKASTAPLMPALESEKDGERYLDMVVWLTTCIDPVFSATLEKKFNRH